MDYYAAYMYNGMENDNQENQNPEPDDQNWGALWVAANNNVVLNRPDYEESDMDSSVSTDASADNEVGQIFNIGFMFPVCRKRDHDELDDYCDIPKKIVILESDLGEYPEEVYHLPMCKCFDEPAESMEEDEVVLGFNDIDTP